VSVAKWPYLGRSTSTNEIKVIRKTNVQDENASVSHDQSEKQRRRKMVWLRKINRQLWLDRHRLRSPHPVEIDLH
jgi:hypothetical protein